MKYKRWTTGHLKLIRENIKKTDLEIAELLGTNKKQVQEVRRRYGIKKNKLTAMSNKNEIAEVDEGNRLIARFMNDGNGSKIWVSDGMGGKISYNNSWDWLMPVVEKISRFEYNRYVEELPFGGTQTIIDTAYPRTFGMLSTEGKPMVRINRNQLFIADTLIEAAWQAVVDFIKWHNNE